MRPDLVCIAVGHGDQWEAFCLDLDLAVQGNSFAEVCRFLGDAIRIYVAAASAQPEPDRSRLLHRKAPFPVRLRWAWRMFWSVIREGRRDPPIGFPITCHA